MQVAQQIRCGKNSTFVIQSNGDVFACGEGSNGRLGLGNSDDHDILTPITSLRGFKIVQVNKNIVVVIGMISRFFYRLHALSGEAVMSWPWQLLEKSSAGATARTENLVTEPRIVLENRS